MGAIAGCACSSAGVLRQTPAPSISAYGRSSTVPILDGDAGTIQTLELIRHAVDQSLRDPAVRAAVFRILQGVPQHNPLAEVKAIYEWVLKNIRYTADPLDYETVTDARFMLEHRGGDCDDINGVLLPSLLGSAGYETRLVTVANEAAAPQAFSHIYCEVNISGPGGGRWIPLDAAREGARFGLAPARWFRKRVWSLRDSSYQDLAPNAAGNAAPGRAIALAGYPARVTRMGQLGFDWNIFQDVLQQGVNATNQILAQIKGGTYVAPTGYGPGVVYTQTPTGATVQTTGIDSKTLMLLGGGALVLILATRK